MVPELAFLLKRDRLAIGSQPLAAVARDDRLVQTGKRAHAALLKAAPNGVKLSFALADLGDDNAPIRAGVWLAMGSTPAGGPDLETTPQQCLCNLLHYINREERGRSFGASLDNLISSRICFDAAQPPEINSSSSRTTPFRVCLEPARSPVSVMARV